MTKMKMAFVEKKVKVYSHQLEKPYASYLNI